MSINLITGATGLVGAHVAWRLLQLNKPVVAIKRTNSDISKTKKLFSYYSSDNEYLFNQIKWIDADVSDIYSLIDALEGIDSVYHCAGMVSFSSKQKNELHKINTIGTANLVNACLEQNINALCHVSSIATLQNPDISNNINESVYWKSSPTASDYAISKYNGEREVWRGIEEGLNAVIVNPGVIIGPGFWKQSSGKLIDTCYKGTLFYTDGLGATIDARDVANCMIELIEKKHFNKRFVITENNYPYKDIFTIIHQAFLKKAPYIKAGKPLLEIAKWIDALKTLVTGQERILTKDMIAGAISKNTYDSSLIKRTLDYRFIPLSSTLEFVCKAYLNDLKQ
jgi:dihydroflavonol-4-reductase